MSELKKSIGVWRGTAMMLNIVLGAGLLTLPGLALKTAGSSAVVVWIVCAVAAIPLLTVFGILGRNFPDSGGIAAILNKAFGDYAYVAATFLFLGAVSVGLPSIALTGAYYAASILGGPVHVYAAILIVSAMLANLVSPEVAGRVNALIASAIIVILVALAIVSWIVVSPGLDDISIPQELPSISVFGLAFMMVFFAFTGWEVAANLGGEFRNPKRDFPLAIALSFAVAVALYLVLAFVVAAAGSDAAVEAPFAQIMGSEFGALGATFVSLVAVVLIFANLSAAIWAVSRMVFSAAGEGLMPPSIAKLRADVPMNAVALTTGVLLTVVALSAFGSLELGVLLAAAGMNFLLLYAGAAAALLQLPGRDWHRVLSVASLGLVLLLIVGRGVEAIWYPVGLIGVAMAVAFLRENSQKVKMEGDRDEFVDQERRHSSARARVATGANDGEIANT